MTDQGEGRTPNNIAFVASVGRTMKAMLNETAVDIMGLLPEGSWVQRLQNRQAIFTGVFFLLD
jgi:hypothetical protein